MSLRKMALAVKRSSVLSRQGSQETVRLSLLVNASVLCSCWKGQHVVDSIDAIPLLHLPHTLRLQRWDFITW